jgi:hypothetical protein
MNYEKGQAVKVKDCDGRSVSLRVWEDAGATVLVASDEVFRALEAGKTEWWPVGVPKASVSAIHSRR